MKIRAAVHLTGKPSFNLSLFSTLQETADHLVLKLAACLLFHEAEPIVMQSPEQHPALMGQEFCPDLMSVDLTNQVTLWVECGKTTLHKLEKSTKRHRQASFIVLTAQPHEGRQMAETLADAGIERAAVWSFAEGDYARWKGLVRENNDIIGEASETSLNLVINEQLFVTDLIRL